MNLDRDAPYPFNSSDYWKASDKIGRLRARRDALEFRRDHRDIPVDPGEIEKLNIELFGAWRIIAGFHNSNSRS